MFTNSPLEAILPAADLGRAKTWYREKLGLEPVEESEFDGAWYETAGARFLVYQSQYAGTNQATAAGFTAANFDEAVDWLRDRGVVFEEFEFGDFGRTVNGVLSSPDGTVKSAWFKDSEGNILAVNTPRS